MTYFRRGRPARRAMMHYMKMRSGGRGHRGGGRQRRPLGHGDLRLLILELLKEAPRHGYDLITEIEARTGGAYKPSPGVMYPALEVIRDMGLAEAKAEDGKNVFHLTDAGVAELEANAEAIEAIVARLEALAHPETLDDPADVRAAMRRLRHSTFRAVMADREDTARLTKISEILRKAREYVEGVG